MATKFDGQVNLEELTQIRLMKQVVETSSRQDHVPILKHYTSTTSEPLATELRRILTYLNELLPIRS